jgi:hypothetical protein
MLTTLAALVFFEDIVRINGSVQYDEDEKKSACTQLSGL